MSYTTWCVLAMFTCATGTASAFGQISTTTTASMSPTPVYYGETPVVIVTVTASDGSTTAGSVSCAIQARGHNASYSANLQNGIASISLASIAQDPPSGPNEYGLVCAYPGSATYAASNTARIPFNIVNFSAWIVSRNATLSSLSYTGAVIGTQGTPGATASAGGIAIDANGSAWAVTSSSNSLIFVNAEATATSTFTGGGLLQPISVAIDGAGQVWVANAGNSVSAFSNTGAALSPANGYGVVTPQAATPYNAPSSITVDQAGSVWVTNSGGNSVTRIFGSAAPALAPLVTGPSNGTTGTRP